MGKILFSKTHLQYVAVHHKNQCSVTPTYFALEAKKFKMQTHKINKTQIREMKSIANLMSVTSTLLELQPLLIYQNNQSKIYYLQIQKDDFLNDMQRWFGVPSHFQNVF